MVSVASRTSASIPTSEPNVRNFGLRAEESSKRVEGLAQTVTFLTSKWD